MQNRNINIFQHRDFEILTSTKIIKYRTEALDYISNIIKETDDVFKLLDLMHDLFWHSNHKNDLKLGKNIVGLWVYKEDTSAFLNVIQQVKSKLLTLLNDKEPQYLDNLSIDQQYTLNELSWRKTSNYHLFSMETNLDRSFHNFMHNNLGKERFEAQP